MMMKQNFGSSGYNTYGENQPKNDENANLADDGGDFGQTNLTKSARIGFIRKVYMILATQLVVTAAITSAVFFSDDFRFWLLANPWILIVTGVLSMVIIYAIGCYKSVARSVPINYILLAIFTICESLLVASICSQYDPATVMMAAAITAAAVVGLTIYAFTTKTDFTTCGGLLFALILVLLVASIIGIFVKNRWFQLIISVFGALLFSVYLIMDTQLLLDKHQNSLSIDDYIWAAMNLYIDIVQLFIYVLQIVGSKN